MMGTIRRMVVENFKTHGNSRPLTTAGLATVLRVPLADLNAIVQVMDNDATISTTSLSSGFAYQLNYVREAAYGLNSKSN